MHDPQRRRNALAPNHQPRFSDSTAFSALPREPSPRFFGFKIPTRLNPQPNTKSSRLGSSLLCIVV
jgi:hypothetical protein